MVGIKHDTKKPMMAYLPPRALMAVARVATSGAIKYDAYNWHDGLAYSRLASASLRHIFQWLARKDVDDEPGGSMESHIANAICGLLFLLEFIEEGRTDLDDRMPLSEPMWKLPDGLWDEPEDSPEPAEPAEPVEPAEQESGVRAVDAGRWVPVKDEVAK